MNHKIRIGILGYGNLGRAAEILIEKKEDMELKAIFTRRPEAVKPLRKEVEVVSTRDAKDYVDKIDVMLLCTGSSNDLPEQGPQFAKLFNTVDGYDNHSRILDYRKDMDEAGRPNQKTSAICIGWDPGLFSINRALFESILGQGKSYTFWGKGVSQGHSDAVRRIKGVKDAIQYTIPLEETIEKIKAGQTDDFTSRERHERQCFVVLEEGADADKVREEIVNMPAYFADYNTEVNFTSQEELEEKHSKLFHGGFVLRSGTTGLSDENQHVMEFSLKLDSNPDFTASVLVAYARAAYQLNQAGQYGAQTILDIPIKYILTRPIDQAYRDLI